MKNKKEPCVCRGVFLRLLIRPYSCRFTFSTILHRCTFLLPLSLKQFEDDALHRLVVASSLLHNFGRRKLQKRHLFVFLLTGGSGEMQQQQQRRQLRAAPVKELQTRESPKIRTQKPDTRSLAGGSAATLTGGIRLE